MDTTQTFLDYVLGTTNFPLYAAEWVFAAIGAFLSMRLHIHSRDKMSLSTPYHFSLKFFLRDNALRIITSVLLIFVFLRFPEMLLKFFPITDLGVLGLAFVIGFSNDKLAQLLKKFNVLGMGDTSRKNFTNSNDDQDTPPPTIGGPTGPAA